MTVCKAGKEIPNLLAIVVTEKKHIKKHKIKAAIPLKKRLLKILRSIEIINLCAFNLKVIIFYKISLYKRS
jgi:hypothetical protein